MGVSVGVVVQVPEELIGAVTGVSGSGPAYAFLLAEMMQKAGERLGLEAQTARTLAKQTVSGAGRLLEAPDADPEALRKAVTSPNGTTERAIETFLDSGIEDLVARAVQASAAPTAPAAQGTATVREQLRHPAGTRHAVPLVAQAAGQQVRIVGKRLNLGRRGRETGGGIPGQGRTISFEPANERANFSN